MTWPSHPYWWDYQEDVVKTIDDWDQATVTEADTYHTARGNATWTGEDAVKTQALQRAWDYLRGLSWLPGVFDTELPDDVKSAQIVGALEELKDPGVLLPALTADNFVESKDTAGLKKSYRPGAPAWKRFRAMEVLLNGYVSGIGAGVELRRG